MNETKSVRSGIYMDYQASTPADPRVVEAMQPYWSEIYGNPHSADHSFGWASDAAVEKGSPSDCEPHWCRPG